MRPIRCVLIIAAITLGSVTASEGSDRKTDVAGTMPRSTISATDFSRSRLAWTTRAGSHGFWTIIATAVQPNGGMPAPTVLAPMVMAGDVYGAGRLPKEPPFSFQIYGTAARHTILREPTAAPDPNIKPSSGPNTTTFSRFAIDLARQQAVRLESADLTAETLQQLWPLTAQLTAKTRTGETWTLEFPVLHINAATVDGRKAFQAETGPILVPAALLDGEANPAGQHFALAYIYFNRLDRADLLVRHDRTDGSPARGYRQFARIENAAIALFAPPPRKEP